MKYAQQREMSIEYALQPWFAQEATSDSENTAYVTVHADRGLDGVAWLPMVTVRTADGKVTLDISQWSGLAEVLRSLQPSRDAHDAYKKRYEADVATARAKRKASRSAGNAARIEAERTAADRMTVTEESVE